MKQTTEIPQAIAREMLETCKALDAELQHGQNVPSVAILERIRVIIARAERKAFLPSDSAPPQPDPIRRSGAQISKTSTNDRMMLSIALRDCLSCFRADPLTTNVTEERIETWQKVLTEHALYDFPQSCVVEGHPEDTCGECGGPNIVWFTANPIWNRATNNASGILCPICFVKKAHAAGYRSAWRLLPEVLNPIDPQ